MWFEKNKIILASASPRRKELMEKAGINFEVQILQVEEDFPEDTPADEIATFLARKKAHAARHFLSKTATVLLAADSVVLVDDKPLGKPENTEQAREMLRTISGRWHRVVTGVCLISEEDEKVFAETTRVCVEEISEEEIDYYVYGSRPFDKAGSYGIQEWLGLCKISAIEGSYSNVVGLPVHRVYKELESFFSI